MALMSPPSLGMYTAPLTYGHTTIREDGIVLHVGYRLCLSPTEANILGILMSRAQRSPDSYCSAENLARDLFEASKEQHDSDNPTSTAETVPYMPAEQLSVHIGRINRKAEVIGGRKLILCRRGQGYRINPYA